jgi:hypothetical protein
MAKDEREVVAVDEDLIHSMMAGDIPRMRYESELSPANEPSTNDMEQQRETVPATRSRKRREQRVYGEIFLERLPPVPRKHTYISIALYDELTDLLPVIARGVTIPNFLDNLLRHHLDTYVDEIDELYDNKTKKRHQ